jgi:hypothetical protein
MLCVTTQSIGALPVRPRTHASTSTPAPTTRRPRPHQSSRRQKTRVWGFEQNSPLHIWSLRSASTETHLGSSPTLPETASGPSYAAGGVTTLGRASVGAAERGLGRALQAGGHTIKPGTAKALNGALGFNLHPRDWGRALEGLKKDFNLPNDFHGVITESGAYLDKAGKVIGNLMDYVP